MFYLEPTTTLIEIVLYLLHFLVIVDKILLIIRNVKNY